MAFFFKDLIVFFMHIFWLNFKICWFKKIRIFLAKNPTTKDRGVSKRRNFLSPKKFSSEIKKLLRKKRRKIHKKKREKEISPKNRNPPKTKCIYPPESPIFTNAQIQSNHPPWWQPWSKGLVVDNVEVELLPQLLVAGGEAAPPPWLHLERVPVPEGVDDELAVECEQQPQALPLQCVGVGVTAHHDPAPPRAFECPAGSSPPRLDFLVPTCGN